MSLEISIHLVIRSQTRCVQLWSEHLPCTTVMLLTHVRARVPGSIKLSHIKAKSMTHAADPPSVMYLHDAYLRSAVVCNDAIKVRPYTHTLVWPMVIEAKNLAVINGIQGQEIPARNALAARPAIFASKAHQASRHKSFSTVCRGWSWSLRRSCRRRLLWT